MRVTQGNAWTYGNGGFAKLYGDKLAGSSLLEASLAARWLFVYLLACADYQGRFRCQMVPTLARAANLTIEQTEQALTELESEDKYSTSPEHNGRRIERIDGGWQILNYEKYRDFRTTRQIRDAERKRVKAQGGE